MRWFAQPWLPATVAVSLIYAVHMGLAGESKPARPNPSNIIRSHPSRTAEVPVAAEAPAPVIGRVSPRRAVPVVRHSTREDYTAIRRICRVLTPETRRILLSCR